MKEEALRYWLALWRVRGVGIKRFVQILAHYRELSDFFKAVSAGRKMPVLLDEGCLAACKKPDWPGVDADLNWYQQSEQHAILTFKDPQYPPLLKTIHDAPAVLFVRGDVAVLSSKQLGIVGSRKPTMVGLETSRQFASLLAKRGWCITSGMALGIDGAAHRGAMQGGGKTVAVLGTGIDQIYPRTHQALFDQCAEHGALVTELPCGVGPQAVNFQRRNRLVSGLSQGILVVEAALKSGSLITAKCALEQGREVFAIPGSIYSEQSQGSLSLIQEGAKCVRNVDDILDEFNYKFPYKLPGNEDTLLPILLKESTSDETNNKNSDMQILSESENMLSSHVTQYARDVVDSMESDGELSSLDASILDLLSESPVSLDTIINQLIDRENCTTQSAISSIQSLKLQGKVLQEAQGYVLKPAL